MNQDYKCPACDFIGFPTFVPNDKDKLILECPKCNRRDGTITPANFSVGIAAMPSGGGAEAGWKNKTAVEVDLTPAIIPATPLPARVPAPHAAQPVGPGDVLAWIEQRSMWLGAEEARLDGELSGLRAKIAAVKSERKKLDRMLRVAKRDEAERDLRPLQSTLLPMNS